MVILATGVFITPQTWHGECENDHRGYQDDRLVLILNTRRISALNLKVSLRIHEYRHRCLNIGLIITDPLSLAFTSRPEV